jgi:hypothetical protein
MSVQPQKVFDPPLDAGIAPYVEALAEAGFETFESCEGGNGHAFPEPTIRFYGDRSEGLRALAFALQRRFPLGHTTAQLARHRPRASCAKLEMTFRLG